MDSTEIRMGVMSDKTGKELGTFLEGLEYQVEALGFSQ